MIGIVDGGGGGECGGEKIGISNALLRLALFVVEVGVGVVLSLDIVFVTGTLLAGPIGIGNLYLTKVEANGVPLLLSFCV